MRLGHIRFVVFVLLGLITLSLIYTQIIRGGYYYAQSAHNRIRVVTVEGPRGRIFDRNNAVLADNRRSFNIALTAQDIQDNDAMFRYLAKILKKDASQLKRQFENKRLTPFTPVVIARDVPMDVLTRVEEDKILYPGLMVEEAFERHYPYSTTGAHILGYVGRISADEMDDLQGYGLSLLSVVGKNGVEKMYDAVLRGTPGGRQIEINARGHEVRLLGLKEPSKGEDLVLSVDARLQEAAQGLLADRRGAVVVMDMQNGGLLSMVSSPSFDPGAFSDRSKQGLIAGYFTNSFVPLFNRAAMGQYPPGSVFKVIVALAALQLDKISPNRSFHCRGYYLLGPVRFGCAHEHGMEDLVQALAHSCNVYFYHLGRIVTEHMIGAYARAFGLARRSGIDIPYESSGQVVTKPKAGERWYTGNTLNLSIGQGDTLTTPLQLTVLMGAVALDGIILRPRLAFAVDDKALAFQDLRRRPRVRLSAKAWQEVQQGLREAVTDEAGTAHALNDLSGLDIWGKTGTAQTSGEKANHAWFAGYAKSPKRNISFCVFLEHGGSSSNAVDLAHQLFDRMKALEII